MSNLPVGKYSYVERTLTQSHFERIPRQIEIRDAWRCIYSLVSDARLHKYSIVIEGSSNAGPAIDKPSFVGPACRQIYNIVENAWRQI